MKAINLTPHKIVLMVGVDEITIPPSGQIARCEETVENKGNIVIDGLRVPLIQKSLGECTNIPAKKEGVIYIVSLPVAQAVKRDDVFAIGEPVRNEQGQIIGAKSLALF